MLFNSIQYVIFLPLVIMIYFILPSKFRWLFLLVASYFFYMCWSVTYALLIAVSTLITFITGIYISNQNTLHELEQIDKATCIKRKKILVAISFISNLSILAFFKYSPLCN